MKISFTDMLYALSFALDKVEQELLGVSTYHSYRVAYTATQMGKRLGLSQEQLTDLAACAMLHDNALTEYISEEYGSLPMARDVNAESSAPARNFARHCLLGEKNVAELPFLGDVVDTILYHHENYDGSGPFGIKGQDTPLYASLIRLGDSVDILFDLGSIDRAKYNGLILHLLQNSGVLYKESHVKLFADIFTYEHLFAMQDDKVIALLKNSLPEYEREYTAQELMHFSPIFAKITDYKSPFTSRHSIGIAKKVQVMGEYYGFGEEHVAKLFLAGALHDIGKLVMDNDILEKPDKLTDEEFVQMKNHAFYSYSILSDIKGFAELTAWAALHHEKLDGSGYPFGLKAEQLCFESRLMGCVDIYQALSEPRPYKDGFAHEKVMMIMRKMANDGKIDAQITKDLDKVFGKIEVELIN